MSEYVELHSHSNFSFQEGASTIEELVGRAAELGYPALALTDHDNLCGAMRFARKAKRAGVRPITGAEVTLAGGTHLTLLAPTPAAYSSLSRLISYAHVTSDRRRPELEPALFPEHAEELIVLSGCSHGPIAQALDAGRDAEAHALAKRYVEWFGEGNFYLELQQNLVHGDTRRVRRLAALGRELSIPLVATNNVHYHVRDRHRLHDCLVAIRHRQTLEGSHAERRANAEFHLKSPREMARLFAELPGALRNTLAIAERCAFDVETDLTYRFPDYPVPEGHTPLSYLTLLCREAAVRRYGRIDERVEARLREELRRIEKHNLAGVLLIYHEIVALAREVQVELGLVDPELPLEEAPPGRGRGSSVAMLVGYLLGLSHIDPLLYDLGLDRFLPEEFASVPDIDLDFPRNIREQLIKRVHERWDWQHAALTGAFGTYRIRGAVRDLGMALGLPEEQLDSLAKSTEHATARQVREEMLALPGFRDKIDAPGWRDLIGLASELSGFPRGLSQHPGGMVISSTPLVDQVPVHQAAMEGRYLCHWDKDAIDDAGFVKIDLLALGALSQMQDALRLIEEQTGEVIDLSRIDFEDPVVYAMLHRADTIGIFQVESAAQMQTITRIKPRNLVDMAYEVAAVRPGVGVNDGVSEFIRRRTAGTEAYDHPLEMRALKRTHGVILFQDQFNDLAMDVAGFNAREADLFRRVFSRADEAESVGDHWWPRFKDGAGANGVDEPTAWRIFKKFNGHYMFPEAHAYAFGVTAYQMSWLKCYFPLEFYVGLFNEQPMGFYNLETLKEDAKRHAVPVLNPDANRSREGCVIEGGSVRLGLLNVDGVGPAAAKAVVAARDAAGPFASLADFMERSGLSREALDNLADAGACESLAQPGLALRHAERQQVGPGQGPGGPGQGPGPGRRDTRWEIGLRHRPAGRQLALGLPVEQDMVPLPEQTAWERMEGEYRTMGLHPESHVLAYLRDHLRGVSTSAEVAAMEDGAQVRVAGLVIRRQRPLGKAVFLSLEDEHGHTPVVVWPAVYQRYRYLIREAVLIVTGQVSRREGTMNVVASHVEPVSALGRASPPSKNWG